MNTVDLRLAYWLVWGIGTVVVYALLLRRARRHYVKHRDPRAFRDLSRAFGYFLVSLAAGLGITVALFARGTGVGSLLFAISSGAFTVVGLYALLDREPDNGGHSARRQ